MTKNRASVSMTWYDDEMLEPWIRCKRCGYAHRQYSRGYCYDCFAFIAKKDCKTNASRSEQAEELRLLLKNITEDPGWRRTYWVRLQEAFRTEEDKRGMGETPEAGTACSTDNLKG